MDDSKIPVRYAKALFNSALETGIADKVMHDLAYIAELLKDEDYKYMLGSPVVRISVKYEITKKIFKNKVEDLTLDFINLILKNKREEFLDRIIRIFHKLYKTHKGIKSAEIIVPVKVGKDFHKKFHKILCEVFECEIELFERVKPAIIGGFILKVEDQQIDASVSTALRKMKELLT